ncbi:hypothetical protein pdam_00001934, partial [Pocillopora damicornis]
CLFITAALLGIGSSMRFYFIASSTRVLTYLAAPLLGLRLSAMFVNALTVRSRSYWRKLIDFGSSTVVADVEILEPLDRFWTLMADFGFFTLVVDFRFRTLVANFGFGHYTCNFCPGCQWLTMSYTALLYTFMALALALVNIGHLSLVPAITSQ